MKLAAVPPGITRFARRPLTAALLICALLCSCGRETRTSPPRRGWRIGPVSGLRIEGIDIDASTDDDWEVSGRNGAVATGGRESMKAGLEILVRGGNAFDATAATLLALSVEQYTKFCFGGEVSIITYSGDDGLVEVVCGQGRAPSLATLDYFLSRGGIPPPTSGDPANVPVPGALHAVLVLLESRGTMTFEQVAGPTLALLESGDQPWHADMARTLGTLIRADVLTRAAGGSREEGIAAVMEEFYGYEGSVAAALTDWCERNGALVRLDDLAAHETVIERPVRLDYRGLTVCKCDTWTQGPFLLQTLQMLEGSDLAAMGHNSADYIHSLIEVLKLTLADRDNYFGDPLFVPVPLEDLLSDRYADLRVGLIDPLHASREIRPGDPGAMRAVLPVDERAPGGEFPQSDTTTCIVADKWGNVVVATPSGWGGVLAGETGIWLSSRLSSFNTWPGHPNCIEPFKRPRITLTPTLVLKNDKPFLAISVAGGDWQDQVALNLLLNVIEFGMSPGEALTSPRFGTAHLVSSFSQKPPRLASLEINEGVPEMVLEDLRARGHEISIWKGAYWSPSMVLFEPDGLIRAAGDPHASRNSGAF
ncbi:MAG: gamma-glutamyltransferase family protein [Planctomycetota bacterium]